MIRLLTAFFLTVIFLGRADAALICVTDSGVSLAAHGCAADEQTHTATPAAIEPGCGSCVDVVVDQDEIQPLTLRELRPLLLAPVLVEVLCRVLPLLPQAQEVALLGNRDAVNTEGNFFSPLSTIILRM